MLCKDGWPVKTVNLLRGVVCKVRCFVKMDGVEMGNLLRGVICKEGWLIKMGYL